MRAPAALVVSPYAKRGSITKRLSFGAYLTSVGGNTRPRRLVKDVVVAQHPRWPLIVTPAPPKP